MADITGNVKQDAVNAEGIEVTAVTDVASGTEAVVASAVTDANGDYTLTGLDSTPVIVTAREDRGIEWPASTVVNLGGRVYGTTETGYVFDCTTAGTTGATEPTWNTTGTTNDGTAVWTAKPYFRPVSHGPIVAVSAATTRLVIRVGDSANGPSGNPWGDGDLTFQLPFRSGYAYNCVVDWGDGSSDTITAWDDPALDHTYASLGDYEIRITGLAETIYFTNTGDKDKVKDLAAFGKTGWTNCGSMFRGCQNMISTAGPVCDTSSGVSFSSMFNNCSSLTTLDVSGWNTSSATSFSNMFRACSSLTTLDVSGFNTSSATTINSMFRECSSLTTLDVSGFNTSSVADFSSMFYNCSSLASLDVGGWDTSSGTSFGNMFSGCPSLASLDVSGWDTSLSTNFNNMFHTCTLLDPDISTFNISSLTTAISMLNNSAFSNANYDKMLLAWSAQTPAINNAVTFSAGSAQYTETAARDVLAVTHSWSIADGGPA